MRKEKTNQKIIRRAITWAMAVLITFSSVGGNIMTVYAGVEGEEQNTPSSDQGTDSTSPSPDQGNDSPSESTTPSEPAGEPAPQSESTPPSAEEVATTAVEAAESAVDVAEAAATDATTAVSDATNAVSAATNAVSAATEAVDIATESISKDAVLQYLDQDTKDDVESYNEKVDADKKTIKDIDNLNTVTIENGDGSTTEVDLGGYVSQQVKVAEVAADVAKESLKKALAIETDEVTSEVVAKVEEVKAAAQRAEDAYNAAVDARDAAEVKKEAAIEQYNLYAMSYGLPKYGEDVVTYTTEEAATMIGKYNRQASDGNTIIYMDAQKDEITEEIKEDLSQQTVMSNVISLVQTAETKVSEAERAVDSAKRAATIAKQAAETAQNVIDEAKKAEENVQIGDLGKSLQDAKDAVDNADNNIENAQKLFDEASEALADLKDKAESKVFDSITLGELRAKITAAERAVTAAGSKLWQAQVAKEAAENYANWAEALVTKHETRVYAQAEKDASGKKVALTENLKEYDLTNEDVRSRKQEDFISVTVDKTSVEVPYIIYKDYVEAMYEKYKATNINYGKGTSTGDNMDVIYWAVDKNGNLTGDSYSSKSELETGRYFIGYTFKQEGDGYHIDGVMWDYTKDVTLEEEENPAIKNPDGENPDGETPDGGNPVIENPGSGNPGGGNPGGGNPGGRAASPAGDVLGAKREDIAMVAEEGDVLGATRAPKTSDSAKAILWMLVMGSSAIGAAAAMASKRKEA